jgi:hypothetical protein
LGNASSEPASTGCRFGELPLAIRSRPRICRTTSQSLRKASTGLVEGDFLGETARPVVGVIDGRLHSGHGSQASPPPDWPLANRDPVGTTGSLESIVSDNMFPVKAPPLASRVTPIETTIRGSTHTRRAGATHPPVPALSRAGLATAARRLSARSATKPARRRPRLVPAGSGP